jgi:hypothetical protein
MTLLAFNTLSLTLLPWAKKGDEERRHHGLADERWFMVVAS